MTTEIKLEISKLTNNQLKEAAKKISDMQTFRDNQIANRKDRHKKFNLDNENPAYKQTVLAIDTELKKRGL